MAYYAFDMEEDSIEKLIKYKLNTNCPHCNTNSTPNVVFVNLNKLFGTETRETNIVDLVYRCNNNECNKLYIVDYYSEFEKSISEWKAKSSILISIIPAPKLTINIIEEVNLISPNFKEIYEQSAIAENIRLNQICGMGYRKSLEFLVKDFAIYLNKDNPEEVEKIKKIFLKKVIDEYIEPIDKKLHIATVGGAFIGNDESHYEKRNPEFDIENLKHLITIAQHTITDYLILEKVKGLLPNK